MSETARAPVPAKSFGPADWQAEQREGRVELSRPNRHLIAQLTLYAVLFLSVIAALFDRLFLAIGVIAALAVPLLMFARMRQLSVRAVLRRAYRIVAVGPERRETHYRETAVNGGYLSIDGERFDPEEVELLRVHRIHRAAGHTHRTHHVWVRTHDRIYELGSFPIAGEAEELVRFIRSQVPELPLGQERSKADTLPLAPRAIALTVGAWLLCWAVTFGGPFTMWDAPPPVHAALLFASGVGVLLIDASHRWLMGAAGNAMARTLRRRYRLGR